MGIHGHEALRTWFTTAWAKTGKKLDLGKACVRFKSLDDVALDVIGEAIHRLPARRYIEAYTQLLAGSRAKPAAQKVAKKAAKKVVKKAPTAKPKAAKPAAKPR
jgi:hypothetical protein